MMWRGHFKTGYAGLARRSSEGLFDDMLPEQLEKVFSYVVDKLLLEDRVAVQFEKT